MLSASKWIALGVIRGICLLALAFQASAGQRPVDQVLTPWDLQQGDAFGSAMDLGEEWLIVGSPRDDLQGLDSGSVAAFKASLHGWEQKDLLKPPAGRPGDRFGASVAISGNLCAVGAPQAGTRGWRSGEVHLYRQKGNIWAHSQTLHAPKAAPGDNFGHSLDLEGSTLIVGARFVDGRESDSGAVYVFGLPQNSDSVLSEDLHARDELVFHQRLRPPREFPSAEFGFSLALHDQTLVVGSWGAKTEEVTGGAAFLFNYEMGSWRLHRELWAPIPEEGACFGLSVKLSEDRCAIGAPWENNGEPHAGGAYVWKRGPDGWEMEEHLKPRKPLPEACFGISLALGEDGDRMVIGSRRGSVNTPGAGSASYFHWEAGVWNERRFWQAPVPRAGDDFGLALSLNSTQALICARRGNSDGGAGHGGCLFLKVLSPGR